MRYDGTVNHVAKVQGCSSGAGKSWRVMAVETLQGRARAPRAPASECACASPKAAKRSAAARDRRAPLAAAAAAACASLTPPPLPPLHPLSLWIMFRARFPNAHCNKNDLLKIQNDQSLPSLPPPLFPSPIPLCAHFCKTWKFKGGTSGWGISSLFLYRPHFFAPPPPFLPNQTSGFRFII